MLALVLALQPGLHFEPARVEQAIAALRVELRSLERPPEPPSEVWLDPGLLNPGAPPHRAGSGTDRLRRARSRPRSDPRS